MRPNIGPNVDIATVVSPIIHCTLHLIMTSVVVATTSEMEPAQGSRSKDSLYDFFDDDDTVTDKKQKADEVSKERESQFNTDTNYSQDTNTNYELKKQNQESIEGKMAGYKVDMCYPSPELQTNSTFELQVNPESKKSNLKSSSGNTSFSNTPRDPINIHNEECRLSSASPRTLTPDLFQATNIEEHRIRSAASHNDGTSEQGIKMTNSHVSGNLSPIIRTSPRNAKSVSPSSDIEKHRIPSSVSSRSQTPKLNGQEMSRTGIRSLTSDSSSRSSPRVPTPLESKSHHPLSSAQSITREIRINEKNSNTHCQSSIGSASSGSINSVSTGRAYSSCSNYSLPDGQVCNLDDQSYEDVKPKNEFGERLRNKETDISEERFVVEECSKIENSSASENQDRLISPNKYNGKESDTKCNVSKELIKSDRAINSPEMRKKVSGSSLTPEPGKEVKFKGETLKHSQGDKNGAVSNKERKCKHEANYKRDKLNLKTKNEGVATGGRKADKANKGMDHAYPKKVAQNKTVRNRPSLKRVNIQKNKYVHAANNNSNYHRRRNKRDKSEETPSVQSSSEKVVNVLKINSDSFSNRSTSYTDSLLKTSSSVGSYTASSLMQSPYGRYTPQRAGRTSLPYIDKTIPGQLVRGGREEKQPNRTKVRNTVKVNRREDKEVATGNQGYFKNPSVPCQLKADAMMRNGQLEVSITDSDNCKIDQNNLNVKITVVHRVMAPKKNAVQKRCPDIKLKKINCAPNRDVVHQRAQFPAFNTHTNQEASDRYYKYFR